MKYIKLFEESTVHGIEVPLLCAIDKENNFSWEDIQHYFQDFVDDGWDLKALDKVRIFGICECSDSLTLFSDSEASSDFKKTSGYKIEIYISKQGPIYEVGGVKFVTGKASPRNVDYVPIWDFESNLQYDMDLLSRIEESKGRLETGGFSVWVKKVRSYTSDTKSGICFTVAKYKLK